MPIAGTSAATNCSLAHGEEFNEHDIPHPGVDVREVYNLNAGDVGVLHEKIKKSVGYGEISVLQDILTNPGESKTFLATNLDLLKVLGFTVPERRSLMLRSISMFKEDTHRMERRIGWYMKDLGISIDEFKEMVMKYPPLLHFRIDTRVQKFVNTFLEFGFSVDQVKGIVVKHPEAIGRDWNKNMHPLMEMLHKHGMRKTDFLMLVSKNPHILRRKAQDCAGLIAVMLEAEMTQEEIFKALLDKPELTLHSFSTNLKQKVKFIKQETDIPCSVIVKRMLVRAPLSFACVRFNVLQKAYACLLSLGFKKEDYGTLIVKSPFILGQSAESLSAKVRFLTEYLERDISEIVKWPVYLTFSLEDRIMFRVAALDANERDIQKISLQKILLVGDTGFFHKFRPGFYEQFKSWWTGLDLETRWNALRSHRYLT